MSTRARQQRGGRAAPKRRSPLPIIYITAGLLALVAGIALVANLSRGGTASTTPINAPVGQTPEGFWYKGSPDAPVKITEFADFQCPACGNFAANIEPGITKDYIETGKAQMIYHEFPLPSHSNAVPAAEAGRCAGDQGKFWPMHDLLFARQRDWSNKSDVIPTFGDYARQVGMDSGAFTECLRGGKHREAVTAAGKAAEQQGVNATPTLKLNGKDVQPTRLRAAIDQALGGAGQ